MFFLLVNCSQKTSNQSRQFEKKLNIEVLTGNDENIVLNLRCWYQFTSNSNKTFDENGMFVKENENSHAFLEARVRSAVRSVIGKYTSKDLYLTEKRTVDNEIFGQTKKFENDSILGLKTQINEIMVGEIEYPHIVNQAKNSDLLNEYDLLKSKNPEERLKAIEKLLKDGSETSYSLILGHWATEKNDKIRAFILKELSNNKIDNNASSEKP